ncbi:MAG: hypothetical protein ACREDO_00435 [Methyloceanibacter sp.]
MSISRIWKTTICLLAGVAMFAATGLAEDEIDKEMDEAWKDAIGDQEPVLTQKQFALLNNLAFQAAATKVCDGYTLDGKKFDAGMTEATSPPPPDMSPEETKHWETAVLIRFGTTYGLLLAEGNDEPDDFCASAAELKGDKDAPNVWQ